MPNCTPAREPTPSKPPMTDSRRRPEGAQTSAQRRQGTSGLSLAQYHRKLARDMTETQLQNHVIGWAHAQGWRIAHFRTAMTQRGTWRTPVQADAAGFPDLVLVGRGRVLFVELKSQVGVMSAPQKKWREALQEVGAEHYLWRPEEWLNGTIEAVLRGEGCK